MAPEEPLKSAKASKDELAVISNRLAIAMAKREALVKSWTASSSCSEPEKTQEELDAEDATLFRNAPPYLGVGAPIPAHFLVNESERGKKALRAKLLSNKGLKASKARDAEEKAASAKRAMREQSSDEEEGRSSLGRAKKLNGRQNILPVMVTKQEASSGSESDEGKYQIKAKKRKIEVKKAEPVKEVSKHKEITGVEKVKSAQSGIMKDQEPINDSSEDGGGGNDEPEEYVMNKTKQPKTKVPKGVTGLSGEKQGLANLRREDSMDAKERRRLKKKEKKKLKKLREAALAAKA